MARMDETPIEKKYNRPNFLCRLFPLFGVIITANPEAKPTKPAAA